MITQLTNGKYFSQVVESFLQLNTTYYVKCKDNSIRECSPIRAEYAKIKDSYRTCAFYDWVVAGYDEVFTGNHWSIYNLGIVYENMESAKYGSATNSNSNTIPKRKVNFDVLGALVRKYNYDIKGLWEIDGAFFDYCHFNGYVPNADGTLRTKCMEFSLTFDKNGGDITIPAFEKGIAFANKEDARKTMSFQVFTFANCPKKPMPKPKTLITIEVDDAEMAQIKALGISIKK